MEFHGVQPLIANSQFLGYASALADGDAAFLLWTIGAVTSVTFVLGLRQRSREVRWYRALQALALLALPVLLLVGMAVSMIPPA